MKKVIVVLSVILLLSLVGEALAWTNLNTTKHELVVVREELSIAETALSTTQADLEAAQEVLESATLYTDPTHSEMLAFLQQDETDEGEWTEEYNCSHFATDVNNNAESQGIRCGFVWIDLEGIDGGHAVVAFETVDQGIIFIEPQSDQPVELSVGGSLPYLGYGKNYTIEGYGIIW